MFYCAFIKNKQVVTRRCLALPSIALVTVMIFSPISLSLVEAEDEASASPEQQAVRLLVEKMINAYDEGEVVKYISVFSQSYPASLKISLVQWRKSIAEDFKKRGGWESEISDYSVEVINTDRMKGIFYLQSDGCNIKKGTDEKTVNSWQSYWFKCEFEVVNEYGEWKVVAFSTKPSPQFKRKVMEKEIEWMDDLLSKKNLKESEKAGLLWRKAAVLLNIDEMKRAEECARKSLELVDSFEGHMFLASILKGQKEWNKAIEHYQKATALSKSDAMIKDLEKMIHECENLKGGRR